MNTNWHDATEARPQRFERESEGEEERDDKKVNTRNKTERSSADAAPRDKSCVKRAKEFLAWIDDKLSTDQGTLGASRGVIAASVLMTIVFIVTIVFATRYNDMVADIELHFNDTQASEEIGE